MAYAYGGRWAQTSDIDITSPPLSRLHPTSSMRLMSDQPQMSLNPCHSIIHHPFLQASFLQPPSTNPLLPTPFYQPPSTNPLLTTPLYQSLPPDTNLFRVFLRHLYHACPDNWCTPAGWLHVVVVSDRKHPQKLRLEHFLLLTDEYLL